MTVARKENYYWLLGLNPLKEDCYSNESVSAAIDYMERRWTEESRDRQNDAGRRFRSQCYLEAVQDIRNVMSDPDLRKKELEEALKLLASKASRLRKDSVTLHNGTPVRVSGSAESLMKKLRWDGVGVGDLVSMSGVMEHDPSYVATDTVLTAFQAMTAVGAFTPSEMLNDLISDEKLEIETGEINDGSPPEKIRDAFDQCEKRVNNVRPEVLPKQDSYIQALRAVKLALKSDELLSELTEYGKCQRALVPVFEIIEDEYIHPQNRAYIDELMSIYLTDPEVDVDLAIRALEDFCIRKRFIVNFSESDSSMVRCPHCKSFVETGNEVMCCSICGHLIKTVCPKCNTKQSSANKACVKCGFDLEAGWEKALEIEKKAAGLASAGLISAAEDAARDLREGYSTYPAVEDLEQKIETAKAYLTSGKKKIEQSYRLKRYSEAVDLTRDMLVHYKRFIEEDPEIENIYKESEKRLHEADRLFEKAMRAADSRSRTELCVAAAERCPDHTMISSLLGSNAPSPPADASAKVSEGMVLIRYAVPGDRSGVTFCIYREEFSLPEVDERTIPIAEVGGCFYIDESAEPGVDYYYTVMSKRWGVLSEEGTSCGPATVFAEAQNVSVDPLEDGLRLYFEKPKNCSRVRIWRKSGSGDEEVEIQGGGPVIEDRGLCGGCVYYYLFVAEYESPDGRVNRSSGLVFSGTTAVFPDPVRDMKVSWNKADGTFTAEWTGDENVVLYSSPKSIRMHGLLIKLGDVDSWMTKIEPIEKRKGRIRFSLPDGAVQYIYPMIPVGRYAVRGLEVLVADLKPFRDMNWDIMGSDCILTMSWPQGAESAVLVITDSGNPAGGPNDLDGERMTVSAEAYSKERMIRLPMGSRPRRTVTIFAVYDAEGKKITSRGMTFEIVAGTCRTLRYSAESGRSKDSNIRVTIESESDVEFIPPVIAVCREEGIPLRRNDGEVIWRSEVPIRLSRGRIAFRIEARPGDDVRHMRLFFEKDEDYSSFRFVHPLYRGC